MNYSNVYDTIIKQAKDRNIDELSGDTYMEVHHIIPRSLNGTNDHSNLVHLTPKEHFVCHHLLYRKNMARTWLGI